MPHPNVKTIHAGAATIAPASPAQVLCQPCETLPAGDAHVAGADRAAHRPPTQPASRAANAPERSLGEVMSAFREQRRLTKEEGSPSVVIRQILTRTGPGSLASDLAQPQ